MPRPETAIPDDPPPHEGAMIGLPMRVYPPDLISIEVLEALPGRPISGERLVRPDGTVSLGFYGDLHVSGLTTEQIKEKVILRLRRFVSDESVGLVAEDVETFTEPTKEEPKSRSGMIPPVPPADPASPFERQREPAKPDGDGELPSVPSDPTSPFRAAARAGQADGDMQVSQGPSGVGCPSGFQMAPVNPDEPSKTHDRSRSGNSTRAEASQAERNEQPQPAIQQPPARPKVVTEPSKPSDYERMKADLGISASPIDSRSGRLVAVPPRESDRVFVDVASYNSQKYYVLGEVNKPGQIPWTSNETVLDALVYAGGLDPNADPKSLRLVRPARGGKPSKVYPIDLAAIQDRGDVMANLQIFPGDRLIADRSAVVDSTIKLNRDAAWMNTVMNTSLVYAYVVRNLDRLGEVTAEKSPETFTVKVGDQSYKITMDQPTTKIDPARRKAALDAWHELLKKTMKAGGPEEQKLIDEVMKAFDK